tara:strand:+ start:102 stop:356 length:255 start_codon:yes stop_codon:yes gene_type:complete
MDIHSIIDFKWFILSLSIGLLVVYLTMPKPTIILKYPTPENSDEMVFKDDVNNCYKFKTTEVSCSAENVKELPIQKNLEHFRKK